MKCEKLKTNNEKEILLGYIVFQKEQPDWYTHISKLPEANAV